MELSVVIRRSKPKARERFSGGSHESAVQPSLPCNLPRRAHEDGLIWGASQLPDGTIENHGHLSLDQYEENQIFALDAGQEGKDKFSRITIADQGDYPVEERRRAEARIDKLPADKQDDAWQEFFATHRHDVNRLVFGRSPNGSVGLTLLDGNGKVRILLNVQSDGKSVLQFLDGSGKVVSELPGQKK